MLHSGQQSIVVDERAEMPVSEDVLASSGENEFWVRVDDASGPSPIGLDDATLLRVRNRVKFPPIKLLTSSDAMADE